MATTKKKNSRETGSTLPQTTDLDPTPSSSITYANDVVAIIAGLAASEVEGIAGMCAVNGSLLSKNRNVTRGVKVEIGTEEASVDLYVIVEYGTPIQRAAMDAQENVRKAIESMTGLHVVRVDVHVQSGRPRSRREVRPGDRGKAGRSAAGGAEERGGRGGGRSSGGDTSGGGDAGNRPGKRKLRLSERTGEGSSVFPHMYPYE